MNRYTYSVQIGQLRSCVETMRDVSVHLRDAMGSLDNHGDIAHHEADATTLTIAADILEKLLPRKQ